MPCCSEHSVSLTPLLMNNSHQSLAEYCTQRLSNNRQRLQSASLPVSGVLTRYSGQLLQATGCVTRRGEICSVVTADGGEVDAVVVGFDESMTSLMPIDNVEFLPGARVTPRGHGQRAPIGNGLLGRVIDSCGDPLDNKGPVTDTFPHGLESNRLNPLERTAIDTPLDVGVRSINALLTLGRGQRVGLFAASGLGKSVLLGMMTRHTSADITVVCLLGERGREVREFVHDILGPEGLQRSVVVAIPADHTPLRRLSGARYATAIAEYFRDRGHHVLLLMDSLTRYAQAGREIGLAAGELPVTRGYPSSVFTDLPVLLERGGCTANGSVTAVYTLLMENDDDDDPLAESAKAILDGHIFLSRELAQSGHFPAIDVLASTSRLRDSVTSKEHQQAVRLFIQLYSCYRQNKDLLSLGMYQQGDDPQLDNALTLLPSMLELLTQSTVDKFNFQQCIDALKQVVDPHRVQLVSESFS